MSESNDTPSREDYHDGSPVSDPDTKEVLSLANHGATVWVEGHGEMTVAERTDPYFGPKLKLTDGEDSYLAVGAGFANDPMLWRGVVDKHGYIAGWRRVGHVSAELVEVGDSEQCECGELLESRREKRHALVGVCPHD
jgi:hypothetical protein